MQYLNLFTMVTLHLFLVKCIEYTVTTSWVVSDHSNLQERFKVYALNGQLLREK